MAVDVLRVGVSVVAVSRRVEPSLHFGRSRTRVIEIPAQKNSRVDLPSHDLVELRPGIHAMEPAAQRVDRLRQREVGLREQQRIRDRSLLEGLGI